MTVKSRLLEILAKDKYDIEDEEILMAIRSHTTGRPGVSMFRLKKGNLLL